jgi:hypothetical protein
MGSEMPSDQHAGRGWLRGAKPLQDEEAGARNETGLG